MLVHIADGDGGADFDGTGVGLFLFGNQAEKGGFANAVGADDADDGVFRQVKGAVFEEACAVIAFADILEGENLVAQMGAGGDLDEDIAAGVDGGLAGHFFVGVDPGLVFLVAGTDGGVDPVQFPGEGFLPLGFLFLGDAEEFGLLFEPGGVVALEGQAAGVFQFKNPLGDVVKEVAVVGDDDDGAVVVAEGGFQPLDGFGVEVVGGFVQK
ncbi:MAG: hypothetical protein BWY71_00147 [Planctomycetes bacterium ADurb.Bin412]|nr:MAG: hypothetical protein BWY71_00147 [Planctomycetes bacterium ADurb.Bin412]